MTYKEFLRALSNAYDKLIQSEFGKTHAFMCYALDGDYSFMSDDEIRINEYFQEETGLHLSQDDVHGYCDVLRTEIKAIQNVSRHGWADTVAVQMGVFPSLGDATNGMNAALGNTLRRNWLQELANNIQ